jgi:hypothetical protein
LKCGTYKVDGDNKVVLLVLVLLVLFVGLVGTGRRLWLRLDLSLLRRWLGRRLLSSGCAFGAFGSGRRRALLPCCVAIGGFVARLLKERKRALVFFRLVDLGLLFF